jgi:hypothetical protein
VTLKISQKSSNYRQIQREIYNKPTSKCVAKDAEVMTMAHISSSPDIGLFFTSCSLAQNATTTFFC